MFAHHIRDGLRLAFCFGNHFACSGARFSTPTPCLKLFKYRTNRNLELHPKHRLGATTDCSNIANVWSARLAAKHIYRRT